MENELRVARVIQQTLLPKEVPSVPGWSMAAYWQPARAVSGDFYDFVNHYLGSSAQQDKIWIHMLNKLAAYYGVKGEATLEKILVDNTVQWKHAGNIWKNAAIRTVFYLLGAPFHWLGGIFKRKAAGVIGQLDFEPEVVGSYWRQYRGTGVQLDIVAANKRHKQLLIGEAKWGKENVSRAILTSLIERSRRMPQVTEGWKVQYALFSREGFTDATKDTAKELGVRLVTLDEIEETLGKV
ncbi:MAG: hypothetical protein A2Z49_00645 [Chloroflexi bacterium RBG_19FT_COMBO_56_12]|nr:MAG: hypothetical protein A2Z49_00645 [Chloroflexi bacterium RBG_19FT_COMBO_56_12]